MSLVKEFRDFALKGNMIDLALAVVIGGAFGKTVSAIVEDLMMPIVGAVMPGGEWRTYTATPLRLGIGHLVGAMLDFLIVALVLFLVVSKLMGALRKPEAPAAAAAPATRQCPECLEAIPATARRCRACTAVVAA